MTTLDDIPMSKLGTHKDGGDDRVRQPTMTSPCNRVVVPLSLYEASNRKLRPEVGAVFGDPVDFAKRFPSHEASYRQQHAGYLGNKVSTTKYTPLNFVPKNLLEQFHRFVVVVAFVCVCVLSSLLDLRVQVFPVLPALLLFS